MVHPLLTKWGDRQYRPGLVSSVGSSTIYLNMYPVSFPCGSLHEVLYWLYYVIMHHT